MDSGCSLVSITFNTLDFKPTKDPNFGANDNCKLITYKGATCKYSFAGLAWLHCFNQLVYYCIYGLILMSCFTLSYFTQLLRLVSLIALLSARSAAAKLLILQTHLLTLSTFCLMQNTNINPLCFCVCPIPPQTSSSTRSTKILAQRLCYLLPNSTLPPRRAQRSSSTAGSGPRWGWGARLLRQIDSIAHMFRSRLGGRRGSQMQRSGAGAATDVVLLFGCTAKFSKNDIGDSLL